MNKLLLSDSLKSFVTRSLVIIFFLVSCVAVRMGIIPSKEFRFHFSKPSLECWLPIQKLWLYDEFAVKMIETDNFCTKKSVQPN